MKKILLFVILLFCSASCFLYSQVERCGHLSGASSPLYFDIYSDTIVPYSQKMLICDFDTMHFKYSDYPTVSLSNFQKSNGRIISKIILTKEDDFVADDCTKYLYITLPDTIRATDIVHYNDTIYFCGYYISSLSRIGYVARVSVDDLFNSGADSVDYFKLGYNVEKLIVFPDSNHSGKTTLIAMGTNRVEYEPYSLPALSPNDGPIWVYPPPKYFDFMMLYCPELNYTRYYQCDKDTTIEKFQDFAVASDEILLVSLRYPTDTSEYFYVQGKLTSNKMMYRTFRTPDLSAKTNQIDILFYDNVTNEYYDTNTRKCIYDVKLKLLNEKDFALTFNFYSNGIYSTYLSRVRSDYNFNNAKFDNFLTSRIYRGRTFSDVIDFEYVKSSEKLMILTKNSSDTPSVYELNIARTQNNYFHKSTTSNSYTSLVIRPKDVFLDVASGRLWNHIGTFNDIVKMKNDAFKLIGEYTNDNYMNAFATFQFVRSTTSDCHTNTDISILNEPFPININRNNTLVNTLNIQNGVVSFNRKMFLPAYEVVKGYGNCYNANLEDVYKK